MSGIHHNLLADQPAPTQLPVDPAAARLAAGEDPRAVAAAYPSSSLVWAVLAEQSLAELSDSAAGTGAAAVTGYAFARTGYHRGLDALRRSGWRGAGPVPWEHEPNRGFLRALAALAVAAGRIGEDEERARCAQFLRDSSVTGWEQLGRPT